MRLGCREAMDLLVEAATGTVPPAVRASVVAHLVGCPACRREAAALEETASLVRAAGRFTVPPGFWPAFTDRLQARVALERLPVSARWARWLARPRHALAAAVLTAALGLAAATAGRLGFLGGAPSDPADAFDAQLRGLVTETMTATLPSLAETIDTWRAGLHAGPDAEGDAR
ncbi:MAG: zf-HC2 domain-containing protein [Armatimonadota bacterium]|nr:zf-HC2 domain-containing protein [Armatimonadota bacterium]MDR7421092.1 zf-HC2 domain-containing protein [Armatimonadota bacterium]MDR7453224.1 zf-HC2 domain-containing protein [Armatimonadota bacterium]MDR7455840.1 zf-HC2 domain-containing protein [Armatimonadota bacterium]MDR7497082.1 zf-HC2 domain-containing protein [Armatimonadota bacterium]